jgi:hypothetical protein
MADDIKARPIVPMETYVDQLEARIAELEGEREGFLYLCKWVERGLFDDKIMPADALNVIAMFPAMPWKNGRWDVDHKPYAKAFYERFPRAALNQEAGRDG